MSQEDLPIQSVRVPYICLPSNVYSDISEHLYPNFTTYSKYKIKYGDISKYKIGFPIGSGKFSTVFRGTDGKKIYAMKIFKEFRPNYIKREIFICKTLEKCEHLVKLNEVLKDPVSKCTTLVLDYHKSKEWREYFPKMNLHDIKLYMFNLLSAINECHKNGIMHRDIKQNNVLYNPETKEFHLGDFGLAEIYFPEHQYEVGVGTIRFMAPEMLISYKYYSYAVDIWSAGVVLAELLIETPFFKGEYHLDILRSISKVFTASPILVFADRVNVNVIGPVLECLSSSSVPRFDNYFETIKEPLRDKQLFDLLRKMLIIDPTFRITAPDALKHPAFDDIRKELGVK